MNTTTSTQTTTKTIDWEKLLHALHQVETGGRRGPILGDGGRALGPFQLHRAYWLDAKMEGDYSDCADYDYSCRVVRRYMHRYANEKRLGRPVTAEDIARIHNGGPNGYKKKATIKYWEKVKKELNQ